ncbi:MAG TPA: VOC family protein [Rhizomicrobium sp.]|jgi:catechol 2,3-dioxygenase-like lactoylglutathione lyase family enzyme|nr:VOC family protein [Rhizomicrobium sp.]
MRLAMLMIVAPDLARARDFYGTTLGFALTSETRQRLVFDVAGVRLAIFKGTSDAPLTRHGETASTNFVFAVPSLDAAMADLKAKGVVFLHAAPAQGEFGRYAAFHDPFGNVLELLEPA